MAPPRAALYQPVVVSPPLSVRSAHALMHLTVLVWGFTAILGRLISLEALPLVWYRLLVVVLVLGPVVAVRRLGFRVPSPTLRAFAGVGLLVALHWLCFYGCIKHAGVAVAVLCLSTVTFFTALLEPLAFGRRTSALELGIGALVMLGVSLLVKVETDTDALGLVLGLGSAFFLAVFGTWNGRLTRRAPGEVMTFWELLFAWGFTSAFFLLWPRAFVAPHALSLLDVGWLLVLGVGCTVLPWLWSLKVLRTLPPYTLALAVTLETVYSLALAAWLFPDAERLGWRFYAGSALLVALVALDTWRKRPRGSPVVTTEPAGATG